MISLPFTDDKHEGLGCDRRQRRAGCGAGSVHPVPGRWTINLRPLDEAARQRILAANDAMTDDALRVLGLAYRVDEDVPDDPEQIKAEELEKDLVFVGLIGMIDPPRAEVKPALEKARKAGIRTVMITGDYPNTARAIAETIGLLRPGKKVMTGADLDETSDEELEAESSKRPMSLPAFRPSTRCASWMRCRPTMRSWP